MNKKFYGILMLVLMLVTAAFSFSSCGNKGEGTEASTATDEQFQPDSMFASIDTLADFMVADLINDSIDNTLEQLEKRFERISAAVQSYWVLNHKDEDQAKMNETVAQDLKTLTDKLDGGSTVDMMMSGTITCAMERYLTANDYCKLYRENPLYQAEMRDWLLLEDELQEFYIDLAQLANWGGTISKVTSSGSMAFLATARHNDYSQLKKGGNFADGEGMTIAEARANLIQELEDAKSLEDDLVDEEDYRNMLKDLRERADKVVVLLDKWLESRNKLCDAESIPESHTANLIAKMGTEIMELIEG